MNWCRMGVEWCRVPTPRYLLIIKILQGKVQGIGVNQIELSYSGNWGLNKEALMMNENKCWTYLKQLLGCRP